MLLTAPRALALLALAGVAPAGGGAGRAEDPPFAFAPPEGLVLRKTFTRALRLKLDRVGWSDQGLLAPGEASAWIDEQEVVFTDRYGALVDGLPARLERTYERVRLEHEHDITLAVPEVLGFRVHVPRSGRGLLEGRTVVFTRAPDEPSTACSLVAGREVDDDVLAALQQDADARELLPWEQEGPGDAWFTGVETFRQLAWPGGAMPFVDEDGAWLVVPVDRIAAPGLEGTFRVELVELAEVGGRRVARLALRCVLEAETRFDHDLSLGGLERYRVVPGRLELPVRQQLSLYVVATGEAVWDVDGGHLDSLRLTGRVEVEQLARARSEEELWFLRPDALEWRARWSGTLETSVEFERVEDPVARAAR